MITIISNNANYPFIPSTLGANKKSFVFIKYIKKGSDQKSIEITII